ncbi:MAG TPA: fatty acid desaturase [Bryobacteraceae bacterium]|nr:fatty acid desaturase [Bryobacteraceae bacterium]HOL70490.1 fatty acid desaturase [Bryobacteraceae bacterium]HOQ46085.1 fatty acid desaturase [Bryobacteraceae bacterium]HPQ15752.1 fatty acid desaturase [Bryobacteraceae bacterium]HPU72804.1 fatty acid desaturase [Bryobacteraceae bacterium]
MDFVWMILITLGIVQLSALATTVYLHRSITHRGLELHPVVAFLMHLELTLFTGIIPREWAAVHRKHHHFSDREGDPHSPYIFGMWKVLFGNFFMYRREASNPETIRKYTPDYKPDLIDRIPGNGYGVFLGLGILMLMFGWLWGTVAWLAHVVIYIVVNAMINSLGHTIGYRNWDNKATNLRWLAWISGGEGLHNNHHEFPSAARFSIKKGEVDPAWPFIRLLEALGLAKVKRLPMAKAA